jgi:putative ABC transport system permease protein
MKTPLAWCNLLHEKNRLLVAVVGIAFAVMIMFMNLGFLGALSTSAAQVYGAMNGDIFISSTKTIELSTSFPFPIDYLYHAAGVKGVKQVMPMYLNFMQWRNPETKIKRALFVFAVNPDDPAFNFPEYQDPQNRNALRQPNTILFDRRSRPEFGPQTVGLETEASQRKIKIGGLYSMGGGFTADGTLIMSDQNFRRYFAPRPLSLINMGLIKLEDGVDPEAIVLELRKILPKEVEIFTNSGIAERDRNYWINTTSIGFIFSLGVAVAGVVGVVIVYQILYTDISEHLRQYATLKALGYSNFFLCQVILQESLILSVLGYLPGLILSLIFYELTLNATAGTLPVGMTLPRLFLVFGLTIVMCSLSGLISIQKVIQADPAQVF